MDTRQDAADDGFCFNVDGTNVYVRYPDIDTGTPNHSNEAQMWGIAKIKRKNIEQGRGILFTTNVKRTV